jgi:N-acetylglucosaminyl-diphospho-decaprenol L-rhamnosyltransferase
MLQSPCQRLQLPSVWIPPIRNTALDLSIIIVSWNVADLLARCLESIQKSPVALVSPDGACLGSGPLTQVIVVDSASSDDSVKMMRERFSWVHLITSQENIGFVRGNNLGLKSATGRAIMLLNPDTEIIGDALPRLLTTLESNAKIGVVGPHTLNSDGSYQPTRHRFPTLLVGIAESPWISDIAPRRLLDWFFVRDMPDDSTYPVDWVKGSALLGRREVWEQIGGLDERYIMYAEEMDWCHRVKDAGWQIYYVGDAKIIHHEGQSTKQVKARSHVHFQQSKLRYFRKFHGRWQAEILRFVLVLNYANQAMLESVKWLVGHKRPLRIERLRDYSIVLRSLLWAGESIVLQKGK